jgi:hypothetical protein
MPFELLVIADPVGRGMNIAGYTILTETFSTQTEAHARIAEIEGGGSIAGKPVDPSRLGFLIWPVTNDTTPSGASEEG